MLSNNKFLGKCWYGGQPWIRLAMESESMVEKGINFNFCLGTAYDISSMESIGTYWIVLVDRKIMPPKFFYLYIFCFELWHSTNPYSPLRRVFLLLYAIFILNLSLHLLS